MAKSTIYTPWFSRRFHSLFRGTKISFAVTLKSLISWIIQMHPTVHRWKCRVGWIPGVWEHHLVCYMSEITINHGKIITNPRPLHFGRRNCTAPSCVLGSAQRHRGRRGDGGLPRTNLRLPGMYVYIAICLYLYLSLYIHHTSTDIFIIYP